MHSFVLQDWLTVAIGHEALTGLLEGDATKLNQAIQKGKAQLSQNVSSADQAAQKAKIDAVIAKMPSMLRDPKRVEELLKAFKFKGPM